MNKRDRLKLARAMFRGPDVGKAPLAPPRIILRRVIRQTAEYRRMNEALVAASAELGKKFLSDEDYQMRIAYLERKLVKLGYTTD